MTKEDNGEEIWEEEDWGEDSGSVLGMYPLLESVVRTALRNDGRISEEEWAIIETLRSTLKVSKKILEKLLDEVREDMGLKTVEPPLRSGFGVIGGDSSSGPANMEFVEVRGEEEVEVKRYANIITPYSPVRETSEPPLTRTFDFSILDEGMLFWCESCGVIAAQEVKSSTFSCPICGRPLKDLTNRVPSPTVDWLLKEAKKYYRRGDLNKARLLYNEVIKREPTNKEAHFYYKKVSTLINEEKKRKENRVKVKFLKKVKSGVKALDDLLDGGIETGQQILISGPNYTGKEVLAKRFTVSSLSMGFPLLYISTGRLMSEVVRDLIPSIPGFSHINKQGLFRIYDLFSTDDEIVMKEGHKVLHLHNPEDLPKLQKAIDEALLAFNKRYGVGVLIIDSLTGLINRVGVKRVVEMLNTLLAKMKKLNITGIYLITPQSHPSGTVNTLEYMMDGAIKIKVEGERTFLKIAGINPRVKTREWVEYMVKGDTITFVGTFAKELIR
ncbi:MAG: hypothetical protein DRN55_05045 [Thermoplasmata archaeon]|nr:MAG: hypothetical protein DRN55_05045 [Thermoplasmata archaeon]